MSTIDHECEALLAGLSDGRDATIAARHVAAVFAHPDDETIGCGAALSRLDGVTCVLVTDGAPRDERDANLRGFSDWDGYAAARWGEYQGALGIAGVHADRVHALGIADQEAAHHLVRISRALAQMFRPLRIRIAITHAYEGGHPDHDATAFAVHAAAVLSSRGGAPVRVIEAPLYHQGRDGVVRQRFTSPAPGEIDISLSPAQRALKQRMHNQHGTQRDVLAPFSIDIERLRPAPGYDFAQLPNGGAVYYDRCCWGLDGTQWQRLARSAMHELGLTVNTC